MGRSSGTGSPINFACPNERKEANRALLFAYSVRRHECVRSGATRPYRSNHGSALGIRSMSTSVEFHCLTCGYTGWSNHIGASRLPLYEEKEEA